MNAVIPYNKIKSILDHTDGGRSLLEPHRRLVRKALLESVSRDGAEVIDWLAKSIERGAYRTEFFRNIEHLTRDAKGLLFWKEHLIGRLSLVDPTHDEREARRLTGRCRELEAKGFPITSRALLSREIMEAPADTPWKQALYAYAQFLTKAVPPAQAPQPAEAEQPARAERVRAVFWVSSRPEMRVLEKQADGAVRMWRFTDKGSKELRDSMSAEGFETAYIDGYEAFDRLISGSRLTPHDIARALD